MKKLKDIGINIKEKTFIIAEIGINHGGDLSLAKKLIDSAVNAGADAVKFQTYLTEKRVPKDSPIFDILKKCELPFESFKELKAYAEQKDCLFFSTPFDVESVEYLESIGTSLYKLASFDVTNKEFINEVAKTGKPIILSVGMSNVEEIKTAIEIIKKHHSNIAILHCISAYPTNPKDANLSAVHTLSSTFSEVVVGQSDHTDGIEVPIFAVAAGAQILEKHYKITSDMDCIDAPVSISEDQMRDLVNRVRNLEAIMGHGTPKLTEAQKDIEQYRRKS